MREPSFFRPATSPSQLPFSMTSAKIRAASSWLSANVNMDQPRTSSSRIAYKVNGSGISVGHPAFKIPKNDAVDGRGNGIVLEAQFLERLPGTGDIHEGTQSNR